MRRNAKLVILFIFTFTSILYLPVHADIIITKDGMVLNGKIIEDKKPEYVKITNNYGTFTIEYKQIKEIHKTESIEDAVKILKKMGNPVDDKEIKKNFKSVKKNLNKKKGDTSISAKQSESFILMFDAFYNKNSGKLASVLPFSKGLSVSGEIPVGQFQFFKKLYVSSIDSEIDYFYSEKDERLIRGYIASAGPLWRLPVAIPDNNFYFRISAVIGAGWYSVKNDTEKASGVKWNMSLRAGPEFKIYSIILSPQLKFDYIYDGIAPLYGVGVSIGAGYKF